jgi:hypothetical protein
MMRRHDDRLVTGIIVTAFGLAVAFGLWMRSVAAGVTVIFLLLLILEWMPDGAPRQPGDRRKD